MRAPPAPPPRRSRDLPLRHARAKTLDHAVLRLDSVQQAPCARAKFVRQRLEASGAGRWIGDFRKLRLMDQNQLRVARDAPREIVWQAERKSEGQDGDRIRAAHACAKDSHRRAEEIYRRII